MIVTDTEVIYSRDEVAEILREIAASNGLSVDEMVSVCRCGLKESFWFRALLALLPDDDPLQAPR